MLTVKQAAERLGVSEARARRWADCGLLPHYRTADSGVLIDPDELAGFAAGMGIALYRGKEVTVGTERACGQAAEPRQLAQ